MKIILSVFTIVACMFSAASYAAKETYAIDTKGAHAFIQFKTSHLGYSWIFGRFNTFDGSFTTDSEDFTKSSISLTIDPSSVDTNHAERDKHLRGDDFLAVSKYPDAGFVSTNVVQSKDGSIIIEGDLTLRGVTKPISLAVNKIGEGKDPWGGYRKGFEGTTTINPKDFGIPFKFMKEISFDLVLEGIKQ